jgi:hypothetical protein
LLPEAVVVEVALLQPEVSPAVQAAALDEIPAVAYGLSAVPAALVKDFKVEHQFLGLLQIGKVGAAVGPAPLENLATVANGAAMAAMA